MRILGNFLWFITGGWSTGLLWWFFGLILFCSVVGIPWARACFVIGQLCFFPFGKDIISRKELKGEGDIGTSGLGVIGNILWFPFGLFLMAAHLFAGIAACVFIITIPFGIQSFKIAGICLFPIGKAVVEKELAQEVRKRNAKEKLEKIRA